MINKEIKRLYPPATIGIIGGGQLGRMFVFEAKQMGYHVIVLDPKPNSPAGQVADEQILADFDDESAYIELAKKTDVITFEFEHINVDILSNLETQGYKVIPSSNTLKIIQNKFKQKTILKEAGIKVPEFSMVTSLEDLKNKFVNFNKKVILKSSTQGYDGKGNMIIKSEQDIEKAYNYFMNQEIFVEELVDFVKEVSIIVVKNNSETIFYPISENIHEDSILIKSIVPAAISDDIIRKIHLTSEKIMDKLDDLGVYCIEYFIDKNHEVLVNEIAPRPHNSGHYTIEGCISSQFEQLVRVVCNMPLGLPELRIPCVMQNILGNSNVDGEYIVSGLENLLKISDCHFHLYGKPDTKHLKKIGHITVFDKSSETANIKADEAINSIIISQKR